MHRQRSVAPRFRANVIHRLASFMLAVKVVAHPRRQILRTTEASENPMQPLELFGTALDRAAELGSDLLDGDAYSRSMSASKSLLDLA
jgi:hypothetical protein